MSTQKRILVVDDEEKNLDLLEAILSTLGYAVELARDGSEALANLNPAIDLVILDVMMPGMNGFEVAERIREDPECSDVPIVMVTVLSDREERLRAVEAGANDFITKPVDKLELSTRIGSLMKMKEARDQLRAREALYRTLVYNAPVGIMSCDRTGRFTELNPPAIRILGAPSRQAAESTNLLMLTTLVEDRISTVIGKCLDAGQPVANEFPYKSKWGKQTYVRVQAVPITDGSGEIIGAQAVLEDVTTRKRSEGLLVRSERLKALVEMAEGAANSFNNFLQSVAGAAQMAMDCYDARNFKDMKPFLQEIRNNIVKSGQTVRLLKQFARARTTAGLSKGKIFDLTEAVRDGIDRSQFWWKNHAEKQGIEITLTTDFTPECYVEGDQDEITEVVVNLLRNAAEALPGGGTIKVRTAVEENQIILQVHDDGVGIAKRAVEKIFEPFWTTKDQHAGMGLAVSLAVIRRHQGMVAVTSGKRVGSIFTVKLPRAEKPVEVVPAESRPAAQIRFRILIIDDEDDLSRRLERDLRTAGQAVLRSLTGQEGLRSLDREPVDAVVCYLDLPGMNGWEINRAVQALCSQKGGGKPVFVLLTDHGVQVGEEEILAYPEVDGILEKPVEVNTLLEILAREVRRPIHASDTSFSGSIDGIDILEYVQLLLFTGQRLVLHITARDGETGVVYVDQGDIVHAKCANLEGEEALYRCLSFMGGRFSSRPWRDPERTTIGKPGEFLLIEAARKRDEARDEGTE